MPSPLLPRAPAAITHAHFTPAHRAGAVLTHPLTTTPQALQALLCHLSCCDLHLCNIRGKDFLKRLILIPNSPRWRYMKPGPDCLTLLSNIAARGCSQHGIQGAPPTSSCQSQLPNSWHISHWARWVEGAGQPRKNISLRRERRGPVRLRPCAGGGQRRPSPLPGRGLRKHAMPGEQHWVTVRCRCSEW